MLNPNMIQQSASGRVQKLQNKAKSVNTVDSVAIDVSRFLKFFKREEVKEVLTGLYPQKSYG